MLVTNIIPIGVQQVDYPNNPNSKEGNCFFQARYFAQITSLLPQTPDPDGGLIHPRQFVTPKVIDQYVKWGTIGQDLFSRAFTLWQNQSSSVSPPQPSPM